MAVHAKRKRIRFLFPLVFMLGIAGLFAFSGKLFPAGMYQIAGGMAENEDLVALAALSEDYPAAARIKENWRDIPADLIALALRNPETIDFVADAPENLPFSGSAAIENDFTGGIPFYLQWDKRWGYSDYGGDFIAVAGCGPVCLSMVATGLTGDLSINPEAVADFSVENGYLENGLTSWRLMHEGAAAYGLSAEELPDDEAVILNALSAGKPIIMSVGKGDFTSAGHFIVLTGIASDGKIIVNDPNSIIRSEKTWALSTLRAQMKNLWAYQAI